LSREGRGQGCELLAEAGEDLTLKVLVHALLRQQLADALLTLAHSPVDVEQLLHHLLRLQHGIGTAVAAGCFARLHIVRDGGLEVIALFRVVFFFLLSHCCCGGVPGSARYCCAASRQSACRRQRVAQPW
jgi:hypothetical protein